MCDRNLCTVWDVLVTAVFAQKLLPTQSMHIKINNRSVPASELSCHASATERWVYRGRRAAGIEAAATTAVTAAWRELRDARARYGWCERKENTLPEGGAQTFTTLCFCFHETENQYRAQRSRLHYLSEKMYITWLKMGRTCQQRDCSRRPLCSLFLFLCSTCFSSWCHLICIWLCGSLHWLVQK